MTKAEFVSYIIDRVGGMRQDMKFHPAYVEAAIERAFNQVMYEAFRKDLSFLGFFAKEYKNVPVQTDVDTGIIYSNLPADIIQVPEYTNGVRKISLMTTGDVTTDADRITQLGTYNTAIGSIFYPVSEEQMELMVDSEAFNIMPDIPYVVRIDRVEYAPWFEAPAGGVKMSLVIPFRSYFDTDQVLIPSGQDERLMELIINFVSGTPSKDLKNDNAENNG